MMNIIFFGTSEFAIPSLRQLIASRHKVAAVVTQPDRKKGRTLQLSPPPTKVLALTRDIPVYQPQNASSPAAVDYLKKFGADLFVVASFGQILKKEVLQIPKFYSLNVHGSLLPKYRGAAPTNWAIINGDDATGVTIMRMNEALDEGEIIAQKRVAIASGDTNITISETLAELGARALLEVIDAIEGGEKINFAPQDDSKATYAPKLNKDHGLIDWNETAVKIHNKVRGFLPWPGAFTHFDGKTVTILRTEVADDAAVNMAAGQVIDIVKNKGIVVNTAKGLLIITHLQLEGKIVLDADAFLRGHKIDIGQRFD